MEKVSRDKMQVREKVGKSRNTVFFPVFCGSGGSKSRLAKAAGAEVAGQMRDEKLHAIKGRSTLEVKRVKAFHARTTLQVAMLKKCTPVWREAHVQVKSDKTRQVLTTFGRCTVEKATPLGREVHLEEKRGKTSRVRSTFGS